MPYDLFANHFLTKVSKYYIGVVFEGVLKVRCHDNTLMRH